MTKTTLDISDEFGKTLWVESFDLPDAAPERALLMARETERMMEMFPAFSVLNLCLERERGEDLQKLAGGEQGKR